MIVAAVLVAWATAGFAQSSSDEQLIALRNTLREAIEGWRKQKSHGARSEANQLQTQFKLLGSNRRIAGGMQAG